MQRNYLVIILVGLLASSGCSSVKYNTLEKFGIHKRDLLIDNVEDTRESQQEAQKQFSSALEKFGSVVRIEETNLKKAYDLLNDEYEDSVDAAEDVSENIRDVEAVARDLFKEWSAEIKQYSNQSLRRSSEQQLVETRRQYSEVHTAMIESEKSMQPVLATFKDNVLFLKHNLNAQAIGSLKSTFGELQGDINNLINEMNRSINRSNEFIANMRSTS